MLLLVVIHLVLFFLLYSNVEGDVVGLLVIFYHFFVLALLCFSKHLVRVGFGIEGNNWPLSRGCEGALANQTILPLACTSSQYLAQLAGKNTRLLQTCVVQGREPFLVLQVTLVSCVPEFIKNFNVFISAKSDGIDDVMHR